MAQICIVTHVPEQYLSQHLLDITMVAVAQHEHPLHCIKGMVRVSDLNNHLLVVIEEASHAQAEDSRRRGKYTKSV